MTGRGNIIHDEKLLFGYTKEPINNKKVKDLPCILGLVERREK